MKSPRALQGRRERSCCGSARLVARFAGVRHAGIVASPGVDRGLARPAAGAARAGGAQREQRPHRRPGTRPGGHGRRDRRGRRGRWLVCHAGAAARRLRCGHRRRRPGAHHRLPDPRGRACRPAHRWRAPRARARGGLRPGYRLRPCAGTDATQADASADRPLVRRHARRTADDRQRPARWRPQPRTAGVAARVLGLLGVPHRHGAVHRAAAQRPQRRGPVQPRRRTAGHRLAGRRRGDGAGRGSPARQHVRAGRPAQAGDRRDARAWRLARQHARWLGLNCEERDGEIRVLRVTQDGPAEAAGIQPGDRILRIDDAEVAALETLWKTLWRNGAERDVRLTIRRDGEVQTFTVHATDRMKTLRRPQGI
ncbi:PDZ domain-containing protein [Piscinibacter aquaticus]|uniref:PDZ domain-containing protein n=1 Tax=Piscinibacter aquaticus TaxID=392597 RepID=A0A5C6TYH6_9BURK|nr:PDZ domain-containing protein [Piscinibacter aquaticus]